MYQDVAFDPKCMSEYHYYGLLKTSFGYEVGRYTIAPLKDWIKEAFHAAKNSESLEPVKRKSITNYLNSLNKDRTQDKIVLPLHRSHLSGDDWLAWLSEQQKFEPFSFVISERANNAITFESILAGDIGWSLPPTLRIDKTEQSIVDGLEPLLRFGGNVVIVDQYFRLTDNPVLQTMFQLLQAKKQVCSITLVTSVVAADPVAVFNSEYLTRFTYVPRFKLITVPEKFFHDRYFFTEFGALKSGQGFSAGAALGAQADKLSISLCGKDECHETETLIAQIVRDGRASLLVLN